MSSQSPHVVIIGGGVIGLCAAYYLAEAAGGDGEHITVIENVPSLLMGASGAANGGIAPGRGEDPLADFNYELLHDLSEKHDGFKNWCQRPCRTLRISPREDGDDSPSGLPAWLGGHDVYKSQTLSNDYTHVYVETTCPKK